MWRIMHRLSSQQSASLSSSLSSTRMHRLFSRAGYQIAGGAVSSLGRAAASHCAALMDGTLLKAPWSAEQSAARLEAGVASEVCMATAP